MNGKPLVYYDNICSQIRVFGSTKFPRSRWYNVIRLCKKKRFRWCRHLNVLNSWKIIIKKLIGKKSSSWRHGSFNNVQYNIKCDTSNSFFLSASFHFEVVILQIIITQQWFLVGRGNQSAIVKPDYDSENNYRRQRTIVWVRDYCQWLFVLQSLDVILGWTQDKQLKSTPFLKPDLIML